MKSDGKLAGWSLSLALPEECWMHTSREDARGCLQAHQGCPGQPRLFLSCCPMPRPGAAPSRNRAPITPMAAILGCVSAELNVSPAPGRLHPCSPNTACPAQKPQYFDSCSFLFHPFSSPSPLALWLFNQQPCFPSQCSAGSKAEQCGEPSWFGNAHGSVGRNVQHRPAQGSPANQEDWIANPRNFFVLCSLVYGCLQGVIPAVLLFYARHLLAAIPCPATELHPGKCEGNWADNAGKSTLALQGPKQL